MLGKFEQEGSGFAIVGNRLVFYLAPWWSPALTRAANEFREGRYAKALEQLDKLIRDRRSGGEDAHAPTQVLWFHGLAAAHLDQFDIAIRDFAILTRRTLVAAEEIAGLFLPKDALIYRTEARRPAARGEVRSRKDGPFRDLVLMLLIDNGSASASEAVAGALQDHDRALVLGRRSFGKALVQQAFPIPPQGDLVWLTVARVVSPSGRVIQRTYQGLKAEQYYSFAGRGGAERDTLDTVRTDRGRLVRGGGGILPDVALAASAALPPWWSVAADSGWYEAVADSVAALLPAEPNQRARWYEARAEWQERLVTPLVERARDRLGIASAPDSAVSARLGRILAHRAAEVRWGSEAGEEFLLRNDPDVQAAMGHWDRLPALLGTPD